MNGLPANATDIRWRFPYPLGPYTVYEFDTTEDKFMNWAKDRSRPKLKGPRYGATTILVFDHESEEFKTSKIEDAISFVWSEEDRGLHLVYDRRAARAYYYSHSR